MKTKYILFAFVILFLSCKNNKPTPYDWFNAPDKDILIKDTINGYIKLDCWDINVIKWLGEGSLDGSVASTQTVWLDCLESVHVIKVDESKVPEGLQLLMDLHSGEETAKDMTLYHEDTSRFTSWAVGPIRNYDKNRERKHWLKLYVREDQYKLQKWTDYRFEFTPDSTIARINAEETEESYSKNIIANYKKGFTEGKWSPVGDSSIMFLSVPDTTFKIIAFKNKNFKIDTTFLKHSK